MEAHACLTEYRARTTPSHANDSPAPIICCCAKTLRFRIFLQTQVLTVLRGMAHILLPFTLYFLIHATQRDPASAHRFHKSLITHALFHILKS
ncbi:unnamed protein product [Linum trigynum]|uniref:Uncharacterized protein n=1 Tax=Linum trigynum TaxID=586398 RepID=A0AAV2CYL9_9ROSI